MALQNQRGATHALMAMLNVRELGRCRCGEPFDCIDSSIVSAVRHSPEIPQLQDEHKADSISKEDEGRREDEKPKALVCLLNDATTYRIAFFTRQMPLRVVQHARCNPPPPTPDSIVACTAKTHASMAALSVTVVTSTPSRSICWSRARASSHMCALPQALIAALNAYPFGCRNN